MDPGFLFVLTWKSIMPKLLWITVMKWSDQGKAYLTINWLLDKFTCIQRLSK